MDQRIKTEWVKRLRSGDYKQGTGALNSEGHFCCLGVLCEIAADEGIVVRIPEAVFDATIGVLRDENGDELLPGSLNSESGVVYAAPGKDNLGRNSSEALLPRPVQEWAGIDSMSPNVVYEGVNDSLADINDNGEDFDVISGLIDDQL